MGTPRSQRKYRRLLSDPSICLIIDGSYIYKTHRNWFKELCNLPCFIQTSPRIAKINPDYVVIIRDGSFHAFKRSEFATASPSIYTNSQVIEKWYIYDNSTRSCSPLERERESALQYGLFAIIELI